MFDALIIDTVNLAYKLFDSSFAPEKIGKKYVYRDLVKKVIETVQSLGTTHVLEFSRSQKTPQILLLFDNYTSREEIRQLFTPLSGTQSRRKINPQYKAQRKSNTKEFYNSLDLVRFYYLIGENTYAVAQAPKLEADDLVSPGIKFLKKLGHNRILLITDDLDWARYLEPNNIYYLPHLREAPVSYYDFCQKYQFCPTEDKIVLYKILAGDRSDHIRGVFEELSQEEIRKLVREYDSIIDFIYLGSKIPELASKIKEREKSLRTTYQMIATIPVSEERFKYICASGRNSEAHKKVLKEIFWPSSKSPRFEFSELKLPRR